jgi:hypothetical protein
LRFEFAAIERRSMAGGSYDTAQICSNGHVVNSSAKGFPQHNKRHCGMCGAVTTTECAHCKSEILGRYYSPNVIGGAHYQAPAFCHNCGKPYPWTEKRLGAARALAAEIEGLDEADRAILTMSLDDLVRDTPDATVAAVRFKKIVSKAAPSIAQGFKDILIDVVSGTVKKLIWP